MGRTVVVDLGGVVLRWDPPSLVAEAWPDLAPDRAAATALVGQVFQGAAPGSDWAEYDRGALDPAALVARVSARTRLAPERVQALLDAVPAHLRLLPATGHLLDRLRAAGLRLVYLSNMPAPYADQLDGLPQFRTWFDGGVFSARVGYLKPEPEIFAVAQRQLGLDPAQVLLLDDRPDNVAQALRLGWSGAVFVDAESAAADLTARGWLPPG
jgi:putative hydrolase of the HAD superfamily